jgi:hypothetical protein
MDRSTPVDGTGRTDGISGRPAEYEAATARWIERTVDFLMVDSDPLYAQLRPEQIDGLGETPVRSGAGGEVLVKPVHVAATGSVDVGSVIAGDFADLEAVVAEIADQELEQTMRAYFALIADVTQQTGNVVDAHGDAAEGLLAMLEKMDIAFDDVAVDPAAVNHLSRTLTTAVNMACWCQAPLTEVARSRVS